MSEGPPWRALRLDRGDCSRGLLPIWLARMTTKKLPMNTLSGMKTQPVKMKGKYLAFIKRHDPVQGGGVPDGVRLDKPVPGG